MADKSNRYNPKKTNDYTQQNSQGMLETPGPFVGIVKWNIDPTRAGRLQVFIPDLGHPDPDDRSGWYTVSYASPFRGKTQGNVNSLSEYYQQGTYEQATGRLWHAGQGAVCRTPGERAKWNFRGRRLRLWSPRGPDYGAVKVWLDGADERRAGGIYLFADRAAAEAYVADGQADSIVPIANPLSGLFNVLRAMKRFAANPLDDAAFWEPAPLLQRLVAESKTLT